VILEGLGWLGLDWDEEVAFQSAGLDRHQKLARQLVEQNKAFAHDGAIRFRMPRAELAWDDVVYGPISFHGRDLVDWVILRSDGSPTYNFSVVADDIEMGITLVMRGDDHISNTPKQIAVYQALGHEPPRFAHVPMIHGTDGKKLSKRHGAMAVGDYRKMGILAGGLRNFLALLGWNPGGDRELFFDIAELVDAFTLDRIQKKSAIFDPKKLEWLNGQHLSHTSPEHLLPLVLPHLAEKSFDVDGVATSRLLEVIEVVRERSRTTLFLAEQMAVRLDRSFVRLDEKAGRTVGKDPDGFRVGLTAVCERLMGLAASAWEPDRLEAELRPLADELGVAAGKVFQPIRIALTGTTVSEPVNVLLSIVGKEESLVRLEAAKEWATRPPPSAPPGEQ
jgi:glutamyl-tRNA synthetase